MSLERFGAMMHHKYKLLNASFDSIQEHVGLLEKELRQVEQERESFRELADKALQSEQELTAARDELKALQEQSHRLKFLEAEHERFKKREPEIRLHLNQSAALKRLKLPILWLMTG